MLPPGSKPVPSRQARDHPLPGFSPGPLSSEATAPQALSWQRRARHRGHAAMRAVAGPLVLPSLLAAVWLSFGGLLTGAVSPAGGAHRDATAYANRKLALQPWGIGVGARGSEPQAVRQTETVPGTRTETQRHRQPQTGTEAETETDRQTKAVTGIDTQRQTHRQTQIGTWAETEKVAQTVTGTQTETEGHRQAQVGTWRGAEAATQGQTRIGTGTGTQKQVHIGTGIEAGAPVVVVPGDGGNQLEAKLTNKPTAKHWWCSRTTDWFRLWLDVKQLLPWQVECWADNMRLDFSPAGGGSYSEPQGVQTRVPGWGHTAAVEFLDPSVKSGDSQMFSRLVDALSKAGGERGVSIRSAPYDFRRLPSADYMQRLQRLVEDTHRANGQTPVVLFSHSMGCLITLKFLNSMGQGWKDRYIDQWVAVSAPWGGSLGIVQLFASGNNLGVSAVNPLTIRGEQRTSEANFWLLPTPEVFAGKPLASAGAKTYTTADYEAFFSDIGYPAGYTQYQRVLRLTAGPVRFPGVRVTHCHGVGLNTPSRMVWASGDFDKSPSQVDHGDGDGTVNIESLEAMNSVWSDYEDFSAISYQGLGHTGILRDEGFLGDVLGIMGWRRPLPMPLPDHPLL